MIDIVFGIGMYGNLDQKRKRCIFGHCMKYKQLEIWYSIKQHRGALLEGLIYKQVSFILIPVSSSFCSRLKSLHIYVSKIPFITREKKLTFLRVSITHTLSGAASTLDGAYNTIHVRRTTPFLVREDINAEFLLAGLDKTDVGEHSLVLEGAGELSRDGGAAVDTGEGNQLKDETRFVSISAVVRKRGSGAYPCCARSQMNDLSDASSKPCPIQLNDGLRLYTSFLPGCAARTSPASVAALATFGSPVSTQRRSA